MTQTNEKMYSKVDPKKYQEWKDNWVFNSPKYNGLCDGQKQSIVDSIIKRAKVNRLDTHWLGVETSRGEMETHVEKAVKALFLLVPYYECVFNTHNFKTKYAWNRCLGKVSNDCSTIRLHKDWEEPKLLKGLDYLLSLENGTVVCSKNIVCLIWEKEGKKKIHGVLVDEESHTKLCFDEAFLPNEVLGFTSSSTVVMPSRGVGEVLCG